MAEFAQQNNQMTSDISQDSRAQGQGNPMMSDRLGILCYAALWLLSIAALIFWLQSPTPEHKAYVEHQKLRTLLSDFNNIERKLSVRVGEIEKAAQGVSVLNLYQGIDLSGPEGIHRARHRANLLDAQNAEFSAALEESWAAIEQQVKNNDLDEPFATGLKENLTDAESNVFPRFRAWIASTHEAIAAVTRMLDVVERHPGQFSWRNNYLVATDPAAASDLLSAQISIAAAERRDSEAGHAALASRNKVFTYVTSSLRELEKGMTRRDSVYDNTDPKSKPVEMPPNP